MPTLAAAGVVLDDRRRRKQQQEATEIHQRALDALFHADDLLDELNHEPEPLPAISTEDPRPVLDRIFSETDGDLATAARLAVLDRPLRKRKMMRCVPAAFSNPKPKMSLAEPTSPKSRFRPWLIAAVLAFIGVFLLGKGMFSGPVLPHPAPTAVASDTPKYITKKIRDFRGFEWVLARNPEVSDIERSEFGEIDHRRWRWVSLRMPEGDGWLEIGLGRPLKWLESHGVKTGATIHLDLEELGTKGEAEVLSVQPCPDPGPKPHPDCRLVTGTFKHTSTDVIDVHVADLDEPIGCTANHPFWSEDRQAFIRASEFRKDETLRTADGTLTHVKRIAARPRGEPAYNLEVDVEHVYFVSATGVLVHNNKIKLPLYNKGFHRAPQLANKELLDKLRRRGFKIDQSPEIQRYLDLRRANASTFLDGTLNLKTDPRKLEVLEEWLHHRQDKLGLTGRMAPHELEIHVKDFMLRHRKMLGLSDGDAQWLTSWLRANGAL